MTLAEHIVDIVLDSLDPEEFMSYFYDQKAVAKEAVSLAVEAAELVLPIFELKRPEDKRPRKAIEAAKTWLLNPVEKNVNTDTGVYWSAASAAAGFASRDATAYGATGYAASYAAVRAADAAKAAANTAWTAWTDLGDAVRTVACATQAADYAADAAQSGDPELKSRVNRVSNEIKVLQNRIISEAFLGSPEPSGVFKSTLGDRTTFSAKCPGCRRLHGNFRTFDEASGNKMCRYCVRKYVDHIKKVGETGNFNSLLKKNHTKSRVRQ